jgi:hypothetical protein
MPGEAAVDALCKTALDADLRCQGAEAIRQRLARGEAVETPHAVYVNALAPGASVKALAILKPPSAAERVKLRVVMRRQAFRALVALEDEGVSTDVARAQIAARHGIPVGQVREIEDEGLQKDWALE